MGEEAGDVEGQPGAIDSGEGAEERKQNEQKRDKKAGWGEIAALAEKNQVNSGGIHVGGVRGGSHSATMRCNGGSHSVTCRGSRSRSESCQEYWI